MVVEGDVLSSGCTPGHTFGICQRQGPREIRDTQKEREVEIEMFSLWGRRERISVGRDQKWHFYRSPRQFDEHKTRSTGHHLDQSESYWYPIGLGTRPGPQESSARGSLLWLRYSRRTRLLVPNFSCLRLHLPLLRLPSPHLLPAICYSSKYVSPLFQIIQYPFQVNAHSTGIVSFWPSWTLFKLWELSWSSSDWLTATGTFFSR